MEPEERKYWAFISYSHADRAWADWLHKALETYPIPKDLQGKVTRWGEAVPRRLFPVFRDREELPTAFELGPMIEKGLRNARFLIVICSPRSAKSQWVNQEIQLYKKLHGEDRILCLIVDGEPWASDGKPGFAVEDESFPHAVRHRLDDQGEIGSERCEPIAADAREGKDGKPNALIKLVAGVLGVGFDDLRRRDAEFQRRRIRRLQALVFAFALLFVGAVAAGGYALVQKRSLQKTLSKADLQIAMQARDQDEFPRAAAYLARSLESDPANRAAGQAAFSLLTSRIHHVPEGKALRHRGQVEDAVASADGKSIYTLSGNQVFRWDAGNHELLGNYSPDGSALAKITRSDKGLVIATGNGRIYQTDDSFRPLHPSISLTGETICSLAWNAPRQVMMVGLMKNRNGEPSRLLAIHEDGRKSKPMLLTGMDPLLAKWSPDGSRIAVGGNAPRFYALPFDGENFGEPVAMNLKLSLSALTFLTDGRLRTLDIMEGLIDWDPVTGQRLGAPRKVSPALSRAVFTSDGRRLIGFRQDLSSYVWDADAAKMIGEPYDAAFTQAGGVFLDDQRALVYDNSGMAQVVRLRSGNEPLRALVHERTNWPIVRSIQEGGELLATTGLQGKRVYFWDAKAHRQHGRPIDFSSSIAALSIRKERKEAAVLCVNGFLYFVDIDQPGKFSKSSEPVIKPAEDWTGLKGKFSFSPDGRWLLLPGEKGYQIMDVDDAEIHETLPFFDDEVTAVGWQPDSKCVAIGRRSGIVRFHAISGVTGAASAAPIQLNEAAFEIVFSPDGGRIAFLSTSDNISFFDRASGRPYGSAFYAGAGTSGLAWSSDGRFVALGDLDAAVSLWDVESGLKIGRMPGVATTYHGCLTTLPRSISIFADDIHAEVPLGPAGKAPDWFLQLLEGLAGRRVDTHEKGRVDPDAWMQPMEAARKHVATDEWAQLAVWLFDFSGKRSAAPYLALSEAEAIAGTAAARRREAVMESCKTMKELWESGDPDKMKQSRELLDKALQEYPDSMDLLGTRLSFSVYDEDELAARNVFLAMASSPEASMDEMLMSKTEAARMSLVLEKPESELARKLLREVLEASPDNESAKKLLEEMDPHGN